MRHPFMAWGCDHQNNRRVRITVVYIYGASLLKECSQPQAVTSVGVGMAALLADCLTLPNGRACKHRTRARVMLATYHKTVSGIFLVGSVQVDSLKAGPSLMMDQQYPRVLHHHPGWPQVTSPKCDPRISLKLCILPVENILLIPHFSASGR